MIYGLLGVVAVIAPGMWVAVRLPRDSSRWILAVAFAVTVPVVGALLAWVAVRTRGTNQIERDLEPDVAGSPRVTAEEISRSGSQPPLLDRLLSADPERRLSALETISRRPERVGIDLLRWTIRHGGSDSVLDAALTLEELELKWRCGLEEAVERANTGSTYETMVAAADAATDGIALGLVDAAIVSDLAVDARRRYEEAARLEPTRARAVELRRARLELVAGEPVVALDMLDRIRDRYRDRSSELRALRHRAKFAVRQKPSREIGHTVFADLRGGPMTGAPAPA
jgi:hypothetical protein